MLLLLVLQAGKLLLLLLLVRATQLLRFAELSANGQLESSVQEDTGVRTGRTVEARGMATRCK
jgi:hypothetical protein